MAGVISAVPVERFIGDQDPDASLEMLQTLNSLSQRLLLDPLPTFLRLLSATVCRLLSVPVCIVWRLDAERGKLRIVEAAGDVDEEFRRIELSLTDPGARHLFGGNVGYLPDVRRPSPCYGHSSEAAGLGWVSLLTVPMNIGGRIVGMLDIYTLSERQFHNREKYLLTVLANQAALSIQKADLVHASKIWMGYHPSRDGVESNGEAGQDDLSETLDLILQGCTTATHADSGCLRLWNQASEQLEFRTECGDGGYITKDLSDRFSALEDETARGVFQAKEARIAQVDIVGAHVAPAGRPWILCAPIKSGQEPIGTVSITRSREFGIGELQFLEQALEGAGTAVERASFRGNLLTFVRDAAQADSLEVVLRRVVDIARDLTREPVCLLWVDGQECRIFR